MRRRNLKASATILARLKLHAAYLGLSMQELADLYLSRSMDKAEADNKRLGDFIKSAWQ